MSTTIFLISFLLFSGVASANTGASALGLPMGAAMYLFPFVVLIEGYVYKRKRELNPWKSALYLNLGSTVVGTILGFFLAVIFPGPLYLKKMTVLTQTDFLKLFIALLIHFSLSLGIEAVLNRLRKNKVSLRSCFLANAFSYLSLGSFLGIRFFSALLR